MSYRGIFLYLGVWDLGTIWVCNSIFHISRKDTPAVSFFISISLDVGAHGGKWEGEDIPCVLGRAGLFTSFKYSVLVRYTHHRSSHLSSIPFLFSFYVHVLFFIYLFISSLPYLTLPILSLCFLEYGAKFGARCFSDRSSTSEDGQGNRFVRLLLVIWVIYNPYPTFCFFFFDQLKSVCHSADLHTSFLVLGISLFFLARLSTRHVYARGVVVIVAVPTDPWFFMLGGIESLTG